ncbi:MAG: 4-alpha-glucanotransferase [Muribaculaceae bacterium]|nr:4-alpha-glucanotransferase [Muribaculaceae bacterium]
MKITLNINYHTQWGESLFVCGSIPELGNGDAKKAVEMNLASPGSWSLELNLKRDPGDFDYRFIVKAPEKAWRFEWGAPHRFIGGKGISVYRIFSSWQDMPADKPFYSSAFVDGMLRRPFRDQPLASLPGTVNLRISAPMIEPDEVLAVSGEGDVLGNWDPARAVIMNDAHYPVWEANLKSDKLKVPFQYKFLILDKATRQVKGWEYINNRVYGIFGNSKEEQVVIEGLRFANPKEHWKGAGTAIPVFSIRSKNDFGVGDFVDIKKMVDWCALTGQKILQILPINDTTMTETWVDSYPYKANSTFALHPMYLNLWEVGTLKDAKRREYYHTLADELNALEAIDYERVNNGKKEYLQEIYAEQGERTRRRKDYKEFVAHNEYWLKPYAAWCVLRNIYNTPDNNLWGEYARYEADKIDKLQDERKADFDYHYYVQYHLDRQLSDARDYAHSRGVVLKGDIPIGISRFSADAWVSPELFNINTQAGAPPDDFSVLGQNWGFPTYNWDEMAKDGFQWWKNRFRKMAEYFDAYRIDHILGFFRIWEIPMDALHGLLGYFNPALPFSSEELRNDYDFWIDADVMTHPLILDWMLDDFFGEMKDDAKEKFLDRVGGDRYCLKEFVNTQAKVADYFAALEKNENNDRLCNALLGIIDDVLFIEDPYNKGHYHPRIAAQYTYQYRVLSDYAKWNFNRLYTDFFYHRHNDFWYGKAMWKLPPLLDATSMLTCAEDLGMIPACVPEVMNRLEILALEIQRMPKDVGADFGDTWHYPYYSVCTTSTHDMSGIRGWWESDPEVTAKFYHDVLHEGGEVPYFAEPWICDKIVDLHLKSPSMLCILPLQDWLSTDGGIRRNNPHDEQINVPANPRHYWRYRMHLTVEDLLAKDNFNSAMKQRIAESNR